MAYKCQKITFSILFGFSAIILVFIAFFFQLLINKGARDGALMQDENESLWGEFPGDSEVQIFRDCFFYNITDTNEFMNKVRSNTSPQVQETRPYRVEEVTSWMHRKFNENKTKVTFFPYRWLKQASKEEEKKQDDLITTVNVPAVGVWYQAKNIPRQGSALTALYSLYIGLLNDFYFQACHQALATAYKDQETFNKTFIGKLTYLPGHTVYEMYKDPIYGFENQNGFFAKSFVEYNFETIDNVDFEFFKNYYELSYFEMRYFLDKINDSLKESLPVGRPFLVDDASRENIAANQWLNLGMLGDSIFLSGKNNTIPGYIEYGGFLKYLKNGKVSKLKIEKVRELLKLNEKGSKDDDSKSLLNKKNIDIIMDASKSKEESINALMQITGVDDKEEATDLVEYLDYISLEMAFSFSTGGKREFTALATFFNQAMNQIVSGVGVLLYENLVTKYVYEDVFKTPPCTEVIKDLMYPGTDIDSICQDKSLDTQNIQNIRFVWLPGILSKTGPLKDKIKYDDEKYNYITQDDSDWIGKFIPSIKKIVTKYGVTGTNFRSYDITKIIVKQFATGEITKNEFDNMVSVKDFPEAKDVFHHAPEYFAYCDENKIEREITEGELSDVWNYDKIFAQFWIQNQLISYSKKTKKVQDNEEAVYDNSKEANADEKFSSENFIGYIRRIMINEVMGNLFVTKSAKELLWGYEDPLLTNIKNTNYFIGGDPTVQNIFSFLQNATKAPQAGDPQYWETYTGVEDITQVRQYTKAFGYKDRYIMFYTPYFDGKEIQMSYQNPWKIFVDLNGTDSMSFSPGITKESELWVFVDDLYRTGKFIYYKTKNYDGVSVYRYRIDKSLVDSSKTNPYNANFYMDKFDGIGNETSILKAPMFISKPYYKDVGDIGKIRVEIKKYTPDNVVKSDDIDDEELFEESWIDVEPTSGACLRAGQKILAHLLIEPDILFDFPDNVFFPVNYVFRSGNVTQHGADNFLGPLRTAFAIKFWGFIAFAVLTIVFLILLLFFCLRKSDNSQVQKYSDRSDIEESINKNNEALLVRND